MPEIFVYGNAVFFFVMGVMALVKPASITGYFALTNLSTERRNEVRAVYGGFGVAIAGLLIAAVSVDSIRLGVLLTVSAALMGMAAGRIVSFVADHSIGRYPLLFMGVEVGLAACCSMRCPQRADRVVPGRGRKLIEGRRREARPGGDGAKPPSMI